MHLSQVLGGLLLIFCLLCLLLAAARRRRRRQEARAAGADEERALSSLSPLKGDITNQEERDPPSPSRTRSPL
jgi:hypothetical protein